MKVAYFGIDLFQDCLRTVWEHGWEIVRVFTIPDVAGEYDRSAGICRFAQKKGIPVQAARVTAEDIRALEEAGVTYSVTAAYPWLIPVSAQIRQVNIHPAFLPIGRGAWPMPAAILKGVSSGVTLHQLTARFDEGDILLREEIPLEENENLLTLTGKIQKTAVQLLGKFLDSPDKYWAGAFPQGSGEYWQEPGDAERMIHPTDSIQKANLLIRAFSGYGILYRADGAVIEILEGTAFPARKVAQKDVLQIPLADGILTAKTWRVYEKA